jgi:ATP synthase protein I
MWATAIATLAGAAVAGAHGAASAVLGGLVALLPGVVSGMVATRGNAQSAGGVVVAALTAEAVKIGLIVMLLWLVLASYEAVVVLAFIGSFLATAVIFTMAFFVRDY